MQSTTGSVGGSRARVIYHTPEKSFAWLHKDSSFADFKKALRARLNITNGPLVIKQIDGDYTLDIETEEEYEAFCHFAGSASQLHVSINGGLRDHSKANTTSSSPNAPVVVTPNLVALPPAEPENPTLGKRKVSQITTDPEAVPSATQRRKKKRKVGADRSVSAVNDSAITTVPPEPDAVRQVVLGDITHGAASTSAVADTDQLAIPKTQKKKKKKNAGVGQSDSTSTDLVEQHVEPPAEPAGPSEPPPAGPSRAKKQKTVVLDLSTVIQPPATAQGVPFTSTAQPPSSVTESSLAATKEATKKPPAKKRTKATAEPSEPTPVAPLIPRPADVDEPVSSSEITKPKPPVSKSGPTRPQVYVEIITKRKTGKTDGPSTVEKETGQQVTVKEIPQPTVGKPKAKPRKSKKTPAPTEQIDSPSGLSIQDIMDEVIATAMKDAKKRASTTGATTDVSENSTPPPQNKYKPAVRKPRLPDTSSLEPASSATLLDTAAPAPTPVGPGSVVAHKKRRTEKSHAEASPFLRSNDTSSVVPDIHHTLDNDSPALSPLLRDGDKPTDPDGSRSKRPPMNSLVSTASAPPIPPPPNQMAIKKPSLAKTQPEEESPSSEDDSPTPKKKLALVSDPDDELDAFLHAPTHPSQRSVLEALLSDSEEEETEREDMEVDEEDEPSTAKWPGRGQLKAMARAGSSSDDDSDFESVTSDAPVTAGQVKVGTQVTHVSETLDVIPSLDLEDVGEPLPQSTKSVDTFTNAVVSVSSISDPPESHMTPISNLKSAGKALSFFNEHVLDKPDPIDDSSHDVTSNDAPIDTEDPIENADTISTPKPSLVQQVKGRNKTASPVITRKNGAGNKTTQSSLTSPSNSMLPPPTPSRDLKGDFTFSQPLDQSTPVVSNLSRKKRLISQTTVPETPAHSAWTTLPHREPSTQSMDDPGTADELVSSPTGSAAKLQKATPLKKPTSSRSTNRTPLFLPGTSQYPIPSSDLPAAEQSLSEEEEEEDNTTVPSSSRVLRSTTTKGKTATPYRSLSVLARQRSIFTLTPIDPVGPSFVDKSQAKLGSDDDDDDEEEDSGVSDSDSDSQPPSHIPKGRRAGAGNGGRGKKRSPLAMLF